MWWTKGRRKDRFSLVSRVRAGRLPVYLRSRMFLLTVVANQIGFAATPCTVTCRELRKVWIIRMTLILCVCVCTVLECVEDDWVVQEDTIVSKHIYKCKTRLNLL